MTIKIESDTLEEAYSKAAKEFGCSVTELSITVLQNPSSGFLGMFKKTAIIEASVKKSAHRQKSIKTDETKTRKKRVSHQQQHQNRQHEQKETTSELPLQKKPIRRVESIFDDTFHKESVDINEVCIEIEQKLKNLFQYGCFKIDEIRVTPKNEELIQLEFNGADAALLIGKEGYRYKAFSYLLYNWISLKYGFNIRLEIAEFLKNQEEMIKKYLAPLIEKIKDTGRGQTKSLDGVLVKIALEELRKEFPDKYVGIKTNREGGKYIVVNEFNNRNRE